MLKFQASASRKEQPHARICSAAATLDSHRNPEPKVTTANTEALDSEISFYVGGFDRDERGIDTHLRLTELATMRAEHG